MSSPRIYAKITGTGSYVPEKILTNADLSKMVDTSDEWITQRTGIKTRHIAADDQPTSDLAAEAGRQALDTAGVKPDEVECIIVGTCTPDMFFPSTGCLVQHKIGASSAAAFDVSAACSGMVYAASIGNAYIQSGLYKTVLVIGGGNVAMDAARSARRLGAAVTAMCLESEEEMPAWDWEKDEAVEEGVSIGFRRGPVEVLVEDGKVVGMTMRKVTRVFDGEGKFSPEYDDGDVVTVECDTVIMAIGQMADMGFVEGSGLSVDDRGRLNFHVPTQQTSQPNVFACGEIVTAPGSVVEACSSGQRAAKAVDLFLSGESISIDDVLPPAIEKIAPETAEKVINVERNAVVTSEPSERVKTFEAIDQNFLADVAACEARRCMGCGGGAEVLVDKCAACLTCYRVCPFDIPVVTDVARIDSTLCQACGMCIADCPANAIIAKSWSSDDDLQRISAKLGALKGERKIVAFVCGHHSPAAAWAGTSEDAIAGVIEEFLPSMSRLSAAEVLHTLEFGATGIIVVSCHEGADRYPNASSRIAKRVEQVRELLGEIGLDPETVQLMQAADLGRAAMRDAMADAADRIEGKVEEVEAADGE